MARLEYKYYIPLQFLDDLRREILPYFVYDFYTVRMPKKEYTVRSIYLDSPQLLTYHQKLAGIKKRNKYRIRGYNNQTGDSIVYLEIKRKDVERVSKDRAPILYNNLESFLKTKDISLIINSTSDTLKKRAYTQNFLYYYYLYNLYPAAVIAYEREAFECKFGSGLRVTLDKNVRTRMTNSYSGLFQDEKMIPSLKDYFILEVKFLKVLPSWMPVIMRKYNIVRESVPKYVMSIEANNNFLKYLN